MRSAVCFVVDPAYLPLAVIQALRAAEATSDAVAIHIFVDGDGAENVSLDSFVFERANRRITLHSNRLLPLVPKEWPATGVWPRIVLGRLFVPQLIDVDRLLYMDVDILIEGPLDTLFALDMKGRAVAAADDVALSVLGGLNDRPFDAYFNSGVLLIDVAAWRKRVTVASCTAAFARFGEVICYPDQDLLNILFPDWLRLSPRWNFQIVLVECGLEPMLDPCIIHLTGFEKPWHPELLDLYPAYFKKFQKAAERARVDLGQLSNFVKKTKMRSTKVLRIKSYKTLLTFGFGIGRARRKLTELHTRRGLLVDWIRSLAVRGDFIDAPALNDHDNMDAVALFNGRRYRLSIPRHREVN